MILREFNSAGVEAFRMRLADCRENPAASAPWELLENESLTNIISPAVEVDAKHFASKLDAGKHLKDLLFKLDEQFVATSDGLWTWLALFFFDEICPAKGGHRHVKADYRYIFDPNTPRHYYQHSLFVSWRVITIEPNFNRLLLRANLATVDKVTAETMKRLYLTRIPCIFEVLERLYWDSARGRARKGIVTHGRAKPGDLLHRFPIRIRQLEMTYDLQSLNADQLIELLGNEFRQNRPAPVATDN